MSDIYFQAGNSWPMTSYDAPVRRDTVAATKNPATSEKFPGSIFARAGYERMLHWAAVRMDEVDQLLNEREFHKAQIEEMFATGRTLYFSDISNELDIDLKIVVELCKELLKERKIYVEKGQPRR